MQWKTDWGLRLRMGVTMFLLFALYLVFAGFIVAYMRGGVAMFLLLMGGFSIGQWYFSDKLTLWSMGAEEVTE